MIDCRCSSAVLSITNQIISFSTIDRWHIRQQLTSMSSEQTAACVDDAAACNAVQLSPPKKKELRTQLINTKIDKTNTQFCRLSRQSRADASCAWAETAPHRAEKNIVSIIYTFWRNERSAVEGLLGQRMLQHVTKSTNKQTNQTNNDDDEEEY